jgi:hypothetical protein
MFVKYDKSVIKNGIIVGYVYIAGADPGEGTALPPSKGMCTFSYDK